MIKATTVRPVLCTSARASMRTVCLTLCFIAWMPLLWILLMMVSGENAQVVMDIAGCFITCATCSFILDQLAKGVQPLTA